MPYKNKLDSHLYSSSIKLYVFPLEVKTAQRSVSDDWGYQGLVAARVASLAANCLIMILIIIKCCTITKYTGGVSLTSLLIEQGEPTHSCTLSIDLRNPSFTRNFVSCVSFSCDFWKRTLTELDWHDSAMALPNIVGIGLGKISVVSLVDDCFKCIIYREILLIYSWRQIFHYTTKCRPPISSYSELVHLIFFDLEGRPPFW